jgi:hypothetical protein
MVKNTIQRAISNRRRDMEFIRNLPVKRIEQVYFAIAAIMHHPDFLDALSQQRLLQALGRINRVLHSKVEGRTELLNESNDITERIKKINMLKGSANGRTRNGRNGWRRKFRGHF